jgi:acyl-CoA reductase-like NAD-dependent aldehyde dehydrogenase
MHAIGVSTVNALTAHKEWATRPPDERYESVRALHQAALTRRLGIDLRSSATKGRRL